MARQKKHTNETANDGNGAATATEATPRKKAERTSSYMVMGIGSDGKVNGVLWHGNTLRRAQRWIDENSQLIAMVYPQIVTMRVRPVKPSQPEVSEVAQ